MNKAVFLDRDGVINSDEGLYYIYKLEDFRINKGVIECLKDFQSKGYLLIVISNQGGIAKGTYTKADSDLVHSYLKAELAKEGIELAEVYYCPHHSDFSKCLCRKPSPLMIEKALARFDINPQLSYLIGDSLRDIEAAQNAGIRGIKVEANCIDVQYLTSIIQ